MGIVYRVAANGVERALKLLPLAPLVGPRMLERFRREADTLARLSHPHIVRIHATGMHDEMPWLVMDLVEGRSLDACDRFARDDAVRLAATLADTLEAAHRQGVLHRDLKPQNVVLRADGSPVLLDFGLSVFEDASSLTMTGELVGTPRYMAPEQVTGGRVDQRTDVFALGLLLYELLLGVPAHAGEGRDAVIVAVREGRIRRPRALDRTFGDALERVVLKALSHDPAQRYATAAAFADDLRRTLAGRAVAAAPLPVARRVAESVGLGDRMASLRRSWQRLRGGEERDTTPAARQEAAHWVDRALESWLDGGRDRALAALAEARRRDPSDPTALVLEAHLADRPRPAPAALAEAVETLDRFARGDHEGARNRVAAGSLGALRPSLAAALLGLTAAHAEPSEAIESLTAATRLLPQARALLMALAASCRRAGRHEEAARALRRVTELAPDSAEAWIALAEARIAQRAVVEARDAIARAETLRTADDPAILRTRARIEIHDRRQEAARALLARVLERFPDDVPALHDLAYSLDMDHRMADAAAAYEQVLRRDPGHAQALLLLAHLHAGASRGMCGGCDAFFAEHPEYLDFGRAERFLLRALDADRGTDEWVTRTARDIAMRLERRDAVVELLTRITATADRTPAILRLEEVLRRLEQVER
jgi:tetratricopeptide (TPR) repeat protein